LDEEYKRFWGRGWKVGRGKRFHSGGTAGLTEWSCEVWPVVWPLSKGNFASRPEAWARCHRVRTLPRCHGFELALLAVLGTASHTGMTLPERAQS